MIIFSEQNQTRMLFSFYCFMNHPEKVHLFPRHSLNVCVVCGIRHEETSVMCRVLMLWRVVCVCVVSGSENGRCVSAEYFTEPDIEITTENTANILSKLTLKHRLESISLIYNDLFVIFFKCFPD